MKNQPHSNSDPSTRLAPRMDELRALLGGIDPAVIAARTGSEFNGDEFNLHLWGKPVILTLDGFNALDAATHQPLRPDQQMLLLYYFSTADGSPETGQWISFADLPDGRFYNQAFQGYTGHELLKAFGADREDFEQAATRLDGRPYPGDSKHRFGDSAFIFPALPRVTLLVLFWQGEEGEVVDLPSSYQILFDSSASHYLPIEAYAILGSSLTRRLIAVRNEREP